MLSGRVEIVIKWTQENPRKCDLVPQIEDFSLGYVIFHKEKKLGKPVWISEIQF